LGRKFYKTIKDTANSGIQAPENLKEIKNNLRQWAYSQKKFGSGYQ